MTTEQERTVTITLRQYMTIFKEAMTLRALESAGVDNWNGWDEFDRDWVRSVCREERTRIINGEDPQP